MLETPHVIVGAALAVKIHNPLAAIPLALLSHFILDMTPHWNPHLNTETRKYGYITKSSTAFVAADSSLALLSGLWIASSQANNINHGIAIVFASFVSVLPDIIEAPYYFLNIKSKAMEKWIKFQKSIQSNASTIIGLPTQIATILAALWWIYV